MNAEELINPNIPKQIAQKLVDVCDAVLAENLNRPPTAPELGEFASTLVGEILSGSFIILRENLGAPEAEAWLKKTLSMSAAAVRLRGSEALIKIDVAIKDVPNRIAQKPPADPSSQLKREQAPPAPCQCQKDPDGKCSSCVTQQTEAFLKVFYHVRAMMKLQEKGATLCKACEKESFDQAIAAAVPALFKGASELDPDEKSKFAHEVMGIIAQMSAAVGVPDMNLTVAAWKDEVQKAGIQIQIQAPA